MNTTAAGTLIYWPVRMRSSPSVRRAGHARLKPLPLFADHAALMTELRVNAYAGLCEQLVGGGDAANPRDRRSQFRSMARSFRRWSLSKPDEFGLLYNSPAPGEDNWSGPVFVERARAGTIVGSVIEKALATGQLVPTTRGVELRKTPDLVDADGKTLTSAAVSVTMVGWAALVGQLCLEARRATMVEDPAIQFEQYLDAVTAAWVSSRRLGSASPVEPTFPAG
ncbi:TetR-like C-terminal domain-containing protein [Yimella lutea]|uniref:TetR-like C-terminal domain-containing protein n=1 Tax=Yimella lutea TaxID=587872 RepID=UPI00115122B8|nr:WHG domain-containing protein [Yimella lutea]